MGRVRVHSALVMRRSRRFFALVLELLVLYLAALSGGVACAACAAERVAPAPHGHHSAHANAEQRGQQQGHHAPTSHRHPRADGQCLMADGCSVATTSVELTQVVAAVAEARDRVIVADEHLLRTARPAPEPPPPRV